MRGESGRENRARGGSVERGGRQGGASKPITKIPRINRKHTEKAFYGSLAHNPPDNAVTRGEGPIFRKRGGKVLFNGRSPKTGKVGRKDGGVIERADGGIVEREDGGRVEKAAGGPIEGGAKAPNMGRAGRRRGGGVGIGNSDTRPLTTPHSPKRPRDSWGFTPESQKTP